MIDPRDITAHGPPLTFAARRRAAIANAALPTSAQPRPPVAERPVTPAAETPPVGAAPKPVEKSSSPPRPEPVPAKRQSAPVILTLAGLALVFAIVAVILSVIPENASDEVSAVPDAPATVSEPRLRPERVQTAPRVATPRVTAPAEEPIDTSNVVRALRRASYEFADDPDAAVRRFQSAVGVLGESWVDLDRAQRLASLELAVEFLMRASLAEGGWAATSQRAAFAGTDALVTRDTLDPPTILRGVWSSGLATRLLRERGEGTTLFDAAMARATALGVDESALLASNATFDTGAIAAVELAALKLASTKDSVGPASRDSWIAWDKALELLTLSDPVAARRISLRAAAAVLEGLSARPGDTAARDRLTTLLARCDWSSAGDARAALLDWLSDPTRYSTRELATVTQWLASSAAESGVGVNDTLSSGASGYQRSDLRGRLAARWSGGQSLVSASVLDRWIIGANDALADTERSTASETADTLREAADLAKYSRAAALLWRGDSDAASVVIDDQRGASAPRNGRSPRLDALSPRPDDGKFALRFLSASQNAQDRVDLLRDLLGSGRELGSIDAEVVFEQAMFGTPSEVRRIAQRLADLRADDPAMINAAIESLPRAPRTNAMREVYEAVASSILPAIDDPSWTRATRAALVARLLDIITGGASLDPADSIAERFVEIYSDRLGSAAGSDTTPPAVAADVVEILLTETRAAGGIASEAEIAQLRRRFDARRALVTGDLQRFALESVNAAEALALLTGYERPEHRAALENEIAQMHDSVNAARNAAAQILAAERAALRIWRWRLGVNP